MQRLIQRAFRRARIPMSYSNGFNPHPQLSFATALPVGYTSSAEWLDVRLETEMEDSSFLKAMNAALPKGYVIMEAFKVDDRISALSAMMCSCEYTASIYIEDMDAARLMAGVDKLLGGPIMVEKRTKGGLRTVDIRPQVESVSCVDGEGCLIMKIKGQLNAAGSLSVELLLGSLFASVGREPGETRVHRDRVIFSNDMQPYAAF